ncbi:MAG TPA: hypothetical protein VMF89_26080, partial [Polyangiales bacterium]|nr:hypothetical protein [Polyangiales bacterium]
MKTIFNFNLETASAAKRVCLAALLLSTACSSDSDDKDGAPSSGHLYALQTLVYQPDESTLSYVAVTDTLDIDGELSLKGAKELPGYAFSTAVGGKLLISS